MMTIAKTHWLKSISRVAVVAVFALSTLVLTVGVGVVDANAASRRVENACERDYYRYCSSYSLGSTKLYQCFRGNKNRLSSRCRRALADAGYGSRSKKRSKKWRRR